jgi:hypothetical protein
MSRPEDWQTHLVQAERPNTAHTLTAEDKQHMDTGDVFPHAISLHINLQLD